MGTRYFVPGDSEDVIVPVENAEHVEKFTSKGWREVVVFPVTEKPKVKRDDAGRVYVNGLRAFVDMSAEGYRKAAVQRRARAAEYEALADFLEAEEAAKGEKRNVQVRSVYLKIQAAAESGEHDEWLRLAEELVDLGVTVPETAS